MPMPMSQPSPTDASFHLAYLTANDDEFYEADFLNFTNMSRRDPGVGALSLTIAVSVVRPWSLRDEQALDALRTIALEARWIRSCTVIRKSNLGRDFSSAKVCLEAIGAQADPDDYVMVKNRSGYGPLSDGWFADYVDQYKRFPGTGLVGSTINLSGHPDIPVSQPPIHVQTYAYLSQWKCFEPLLDDFPGSACTERSDVVLHGEIGLSRRFLERGLGLSCLAWPDRVFSLPELDTAGLPKEDIKRRVRGVPFHYKFRRYGFAGLNLLRRARWRRHLRSLAPADEQLNGQTDTAA